MNLSPKELAAFPQGKLNELENPNKRAMYGAMGINVGNVQEAEGIKSVLQSAIAGQGAQQTAPGGSIVDRMAMAVKAKVDQQKQQEAMQRHQAEMMKVAMGFRENQQRRREDQQRQMAEENGVGSLPVPDQEYAEGGIVAFVGGGSARDELRNTEREMEMSNPEIYARKKIASKKEEPTEPANKEDWLSTLRKEADKEYEDRMAAISDVERPNEAKIREDYTNRDIEVSKPYVDKMNDLMREMLPNTEGIRNQNRSNSIITAGLQMLQARGGPGFAGGLAGIAGGAQRGLNQYQEGEQDLQNQLQKHQAFQMEGIKNELGMRRDRMRYAEDAVRNAEREYGIDSRERKAAVAAAERARTDYLRAGIEAKKIENRAITDERNANIKHEQMLATLARIGSHNGGGGAGNRALEWDRRQAFAEYRKILSDPQHPKVREFKAMLRQDPAYKEADKDTQKRMMSEGLPAFVARSIEDDFGIRPYPNAAGIKSVAPAAPAAGKPPPGKYLGPLIP